MIDIYHVLGCRLNRRQLNLLYESFDFSDDPKNEEVILDAYFDNDQFVVVYDVYSNQVLKESGNKYEPQDLDPLKKEKFKKLFRTVGIVVVDVFKKGIAGEFVKRYEGKTLSEALRLASDDNAKDLPQLLWSATRILPDLSIDKIVELSSF